MTVGARKEWFLGIPLGREREVLPHPDLPVGTAFTNPRLDWSPTGGVLFVADNKTVRFHLDGGSVPYSEEDINKARITSPRNLLGVRNVYRYEDDSSMPLRQYFEKTLSGASRTDPRAQAYYDALVFGNLDFNQGSEEIPTGFREKFEADCLSRSEADKEYERALDWYKKLLEGIDHDDSLVLTHLNYLAQVKYGTNGFTYFRNLLSSYPTAS